MSSFGIYLYFKSSLPRMQPPRFHVTLCLHEGKGKVF